MTDDNLYFDFLTSDPHAGRYSLMKKFNLSEHQARKIVTAFRLLNPPKSDISIDSAISKFTDKFRDNIAKHPMNININYTNPFSGSIAEDAVLLLSDMQIGRKNSFLNPETNQLELTYNFDIMVKQANRLVESIWQIVSLLKSGYQINKLWIFSLGDIVDNDFIFKGQPFFLDMNTGDQLWQGTAVVADMFKSFLKIFKEVEIVAVPGNHGRHTARREASPAIRNFDYHFYRILELIFKGEERIKFDISPDYFYYPKIYDWSYMIHHGDDVYSWMGLPYYGIVRKSKARQNEFRYYVECIGHFHTSMVIPTSSKSYTIVNGGWIPKDNHAWQEFGVLSKPEQTFFGVSPKRPRTWSFDLDLNHI